MSSKGWIKIHRKIMESAIWSDPLRLKAWMHILLSANHEDKDVFMNGTRVIVREGQFITSNRKLQAAWGCSTNTVRRILQQLQDMDMIEHETPQQRYTLLTVINYGFYQDRGYGDGDSDRDTDRDSDRDSDGVQTRIIKNDKELKNKYTASPDEDEDGEDPYADIDESEWMSPEEFAAKYTQQ